MAKAAQTEELADAFREHEEQTREQVSRLEKVFKLIGEKPQAKKCPAIVGKGWARELGLNMP
jgi:ferritin-like metal-binding protein YciE